ncbi:hypothetical protein [Burkholderia gladioli]|uniref:hypothetical protein n=1 Tax=Burkholderia gladioli TaxID=28095 RepID=UPI0007C68790|nr:hypothetical protein [Burkholderia gladioli]
MDTSQSSEAAAPRGWKAAKISRISTLLEAHRKAATILDERHMEIVSLRTAVCESANFFGRKRPHMTAIADLLEATFSLTASCHLSTVRQLTVQMQCALEKALASLHDLPDSEIVTATSSRTMDDAMAELLKNCEINSALLKRVVENAEQEIHSLQKMLVDFG